FGPHAEVVGVGKQTAVVPRVRRGARVPLDHLPAATAGAHPELVARVWTAGRARGEGDRSAVDLRRTRSGCDRDAGADRRVDRVRDAVHGLERNGRSTTPRVDTDVVDPCEGGLRPAPGVRRAV